jgi:hypothetical protein
MFGDVRTRGIYGIEKAANPRRVAACTCHFGQKSSPMGGHRNQASDAIHDNAPHFPSLHADYVCFQTLFHRPSQIGSKRDSLLIFALTLDASE